MHYFWFTNSSCRYIITSPINHLRFTSNGFHLQWNFNKINLNSLQHFTNSSRTNYWLLTLKKILYHLSSQGQTINQSSMVQFAKDEIVMNMYLGANIFIHIRTITVESHSPVSFFDQIIILMTFTFVFIKKQGQAIVVLKALVIGLIAGDLWTLRLSSAHLH